MKQPCGCCAGIEVVTPQPEANRPGLPALAYRAGTYATFLESMMARISSIYLEVPASDGSGNVQRIFPLNGLVLNSDGKTFARIGPGLSTRELSDPAIALLDAWATVADVLTFYEERIANEGYLRTATETRSVLELARLVGYKLRPGVSSSVYLAFTTAAGFDGIIPAGTRAQSIPAVGQTPQPFETSDDLPARDVWNDVGVRLTRPQVITLSSNPSAQTVTIDQGTDAATRDTLYFAGTSTNLNVGDALLIVSGDGGGQQCLRIVASVSAQADQNRTEVTLQESLPSVPQTGGGASVALTRLQSTLNPFIADATNIFSGGDLASQVASILQTLITNAKTLAADPNATAAGVADKLLPVIPQIQEIHDIAAQRSFTRLEPWIADILNDLTSLVEQLPGLDDARGTVVSPAITNATVESIPPGLGNLFAIRDQLALPPSLQPANTFRLTRSVQRAFAPESDTAPRLLATFKPKIASTLYQAWGAIQTPAAPIQVFAMRVKASLFGNNAPLQVTYTVGPAPGNTADTVSTPGYSDWPVNEPGTQVDLDSNYPKITPNSWIVIQTTNTNITKAQTQYAKAGSPTIISRGDYGMSGKTTRIQLLENVNWITTPPTGNNTPPNDDFQGVRQTVVYAQPEELDLAEEPLDRDVEGSTIELDGLYDGLESGRWIIVSGNRTDITDSTGATNATGVVGNELVMISQVTQGPGKQSCMPLTVDAVPFSNVYGVIGPLTTTTSGYPDTVGDMLIVGAPNAGFVQFLQSFPLPNTPSGNQEICAPLQLAPGLYANTYLPTSAERNGDFTPFSGLIDPSTGKTFSGTLPAASDPNSPPAVYAWRISSLASGNDTLHTTIVLANNLAYEYDSSKVTIYANVAKATHGQTQGEVLGDGDASQALQQFPLSQSPLTYLPAPTPSGAQSTLIVTVNEVKWQEADNLFVLGPSDREYITQTDDSEKTTVITGDGTHGLRVPTGTANVKAIYRSGTGQVGNVDALQISQLATQPLGVQSVINPLPAAGGADGDTRDQARRNIPIGLTALDRLVSVQDYADFARSFAGIGKASSVRLTNGRKLLVHITIAGKDDVPIDPTTDLYQALVQALELAGDPNQPIQIDLRQLKVLVIAAGVEIQSDYTWESVAANLRATLLDLYSFDNRDLGQTAFLSEAVSAMQAVAGVQYVNLQTFDSVPETVTAAQLASLASSLTLNSFVQANLAHVCPSATATGGIAPAQLVILTPDIPDTLILTEITT